METQVIELAKEGLAKSVTLAVQALEEGKVIIYPTETSYGIGCSVEEVEAVKRIFEVKQRQPGKPLLVLVDHIKTMEDYGRINPTAKKLSRHFMPGPLTLVIDKTEKVPDIVNQKEIAFRVSSNAFAFNLCAKFGKPITSASANIEGRPPIYSGMGAVKEFEGKVDLIVDAGSLPQTKPSTLYDSRSRKILREGPINAAEIEAVLERE